MKRKPATHSPRKGARSPADLPDSDVADDSLERIVARPDGYHWLSPDARREFGPFESVDAARTNMQAIDEGIEADPPEALLEAERGVGIADWIDPDTGEPAEGQSTPHLVEE